MAGAKDYNKTDVLIVGAGPAGLACAISLKKNNPALEVCVVEKAAGPGEHNLSGAVLEAHSLHKLLDDTVPGWSETEQAKKILARRVDKDKVLFMPCSKTAFNIAWTIKTAKALGLGFGQMLHEGDYICSISELTAWLGQIAKDLGAEIITGFAVEEIILDETTHLATGVKLVDRGLDKEGNRQPNYTPGETITAGVVVLAEGCDGLVTEKFIEKAGLSRSGEQLYSIGVKEIIKVSDAQYEKFGPGTVIHAMGYPLWTPLIGPAMFGGGIMYAMGDNKIAVGMIVGLDWKYYDFNPQDALGLFKRHRFVKKFIEGGTVVEAGAKMIPEGGARAVPRDSAGNIGKANVLLAGDSAGFVNMLKIKGLHNAIISGTEAGLAIAHNFEHRLGLAGVYTRRLKAAGVLKEMESARSFRQTVARFGPLQGMPLSVLGKLLPDFDIEPDYEAMTSLRYRYKPAVKFDKDTFTAMAATEHREEQPCHLKIIDPAICRDKCLPKFEAPCITFCPAGVYETIHDQPKPANPSNCLHCKTCQRKCPFDNIRWTVPEGAGGPRYKSM